MNISKYIQDVCESFSIEVKSVNKKISLKETLEKAHQYITDGLLNDWYCENTVYSEKDMRIAQLEIIRTVMSICNNRGRF